MLPFIFSAIFIYALLFLPYLPCCGVAAFYLGFLKMKRKVVEIVPVSID
jgi:hypothetical protein